MSTLKELLYNKIIYVFRPKDLIISSSRYFGLHQKQKLQTLSESRVSSSRRSLSSHNQILETLLFESGIVSASVSFCPSDQQSFMSELDSQVPTAFDPFADANAEDSGAGTKEYVHIRVQQRNGRKSLTTVQGLKKEYSYSKILKDLKKEFCCNGTVVQDSELGQVIQLQGDQRKNVSTFLVQAGLVKKDNIKIHGKEMEEIFALIVSMILIAAVIPLFLWKRRVDSSRSREEDAAPPPQQVQARENVGRGTGGGGRRMRRRPAASAGASSSSASNVQENISGSEDEEEDEAGGNQARASKKKEKKRQEREEQRQAEEAARESRSTKQDWYAEMRRKKDEEREAEERKLEEEEKAREAKEEEAAALEFDKWKGEFSVDAEGTTEEVEGGNQDLLSEFVEYIKKQKCVPLEDLAAEFHLRTQECINRIASLESIGRLSGVMDDRGKYIYISMEEMNAVADYIKRQGRVSISHLASKSNQFIDLEPKVQHDLTEEISGVVFKRYVEIGRVALVNYGKDHGKLVVIVDVVDQNRALVDAPDMERIQMNFKRLSLTDIVIEINRVPKKKALIEAMEKADVKNKWEKSSWGRKLIVQKRRASLNDFDRFKIMLAKIKKAGVVRQELAKLKKEITA
ncbi:unnamed protein product [Brassica rapa subsp. narinosa]